MNDYKHVFGLNTKQDINQFIYDFLDFGKFYRNIGFYPSPQTNFVKTCKLTNKKVINLFIDDFVQLDKVDEMIKMAQRKFEEKEIGLDIFREEHDRNMLKMEEKKLKQIFRNYLNK